MLRKLHLGKEVEAWRVSKKHVSASAGRPERVAEIPALKHAASLVP